MTERVVNVRASRAAVRQLISHLPEFIMGEGGAKSLSDAMMARLGFTLLGHIRRAFLVKALGGTDEAGDKWPPLSPKTIAYRRRHAGLPPAHQRAASRPSYMLTAKQRERWWELYRRGLGQFKGNKGRAAKMAWFVLKREGAETLISKYGNAPVEILRDTGLLLNSLSPGVNAAEQVFRIGDGEVSVGTNREGAADHHRGIPGRLPQRRLWPPVPRWPTSWWDDIKEQARDGTVDIIIYVFTRMGAA